MSATPKRKPLKTTGRSAASGSGSASKRRTPSASTASAAAGAGAAGGGAAGGARSWDDLEHDDIAEMKEAFDKFDKTEEGAVRPEDLATLIRSLGYNPSEKDVRDVLEKVHLTEENLVVFTEFLNASVEKMQPADDESVILEAWQVLDAQGNGYITSGQLFHVMTNLGEKLSKEEVDDMIREADPQAAGTIDYAAFTKAMMKTQINVWRPPPE